MGGRDDGMGHGASANQPNCTPAVKSFRRIRPRPQGEPGGNTLNSLFSRAEADRFNYRIDTVRLAEPVLDYVSRLRVSRRTQLNLDHDNARVGRAVDGLDLDLGRWLSPAGMVTRVAQGSGSPRPRRRNPWFCRGSVRGCARIAGTGNDAPCPSRSALERPSPSRRLLLRRHGREPSTVDRHHHGIADGRQGCCHRSPRRCSTYLPGGGWA